MNASRVLQCGLVAAVLVLSSACQRARSDGSPLSRAYELIATNETSGDLSVIDPEAGSVVASVQMGKRPRGMALSADRRYLFVALSGWPIAPPGTDESTLPAPDPTADGIGVFDVARRKLVKILRGVPNPEQLAVSANGRLYAPSEELEAVVVLDTGSGRTLTTIKVGGTPEGVAIRPDGAILYVTVENENKLAVIDTRTNVILTKIAVGGRARSVLFAPNGARAYVTNELDGTISIIDAHQHRVLNTVPLPGTGLRPMGMAVSPDGQRLYVTTGRGGTLSAIDLASQAVVASTVVGQRPWGVAISPDGRYLYTANGPSDDVTTISAADLQIIRRTKVGSRPWGVTVAPVATGR